MPSNAFLLSVSSASTSTTRRRHAALVMPGSLHRTDASSSSTACARRPVSSSSSRNAVSLKSSPAPTKPAGASRHMLPRGGRYWLMRMTSASRPLIRSTGKIATALAWGAMSGEPGCAGKGLSAASHSRWRPLSSCHWSLTSCSHRVDPTVVLPRILGWPASPSLPSPALAPNLRSPARRHEGRRGRAKDEAEAPYTGGDTKQARGASGSPLVPRCKKQEDDVSVAATVAANPLITEPVKYTHEPS